MKGAFKPYTGRKGLVGLPWGVLGQTVVRNGVCVSILVTGEVLLRNHSFLKEGSLASSSPCRIHLWSSFGEINECLRIALCYLTAGGAFKCFEIFLRRRF